MTHDYWLIAHKPGAPLFIRKRLSAGVRAWRLYWTHRKLAYGWQQRSRATAARLFAREVMRPEHYGYWK